MNNQERFDLIVYAIVIAIVITGLGGFCYLVLLGVHEVIGATITFGSAAVVALPILEAGGGIAVAGITINFVYNQIKKAEHDPYKWLVPIMGILAAFIIDVFKEVIAKLPGQHVDSVGENIVTACIAGITAIIYIAGGFLWRQEFKGWKIWMVRIVAIILFLAPLLVAYLWYITSHSNAELIHCITSLQLEVIIPIAAFLVLFIITVVISFVYRNKSSY